MFSSIRILSMYVSAAVILMAARSTVSGAQVMGPDGKQIDTAAFYNKERSDSLDAAVYTTRQNGNYLSKGKDIRTEVISAAGLCKMACCNLAESFENSASVTVGYADAVTGARQIRLLGLNGIYTQMLDENRPVMRGLSAPFGLSYIPGQWLESIQIAKGAASVINGVESITGQINMEHRKPTDEKPLFVNVAAMSDSKVDVNLASSLQFSPEWSTVILGHVSSNQRSMDGNGDGFLDDPLATQVNFANRWLYYAPSGVQVRFGLKALRDERCGGQEDDSHMGVPGYDYGNYMKDLTTPWGSDISNQSVDAFLKVGVPLNGENTQNVALVTDFCYQDMDSYFGRTKYLADQYSGFVNLLYQNELDESNKLTAGFGGTVDRCLDFIDRDYLLLDDIIRNNAVTLANGGILMEYTHHEGDKFSAIMGLRADYYKDFGIRYSPRVTLKYTPFDDLVLRANAGRGLRRAMPLVDNIGVLSTSKNYLGSFFDHPLEDAWIVGGNATYYLPFGASSNTYFSLDFFRTQFSEQMVLDYEHVARSIDFYSLSSIGGKSYTNTFQADFSVEPVERFTVTATFRYSDARQSFADRGLLEKPMTSRYKGVLNLQYAANLNKWIFDFTASVNGPCKVYDFMADRTDAEGNLIYRNGLSPVYPLLYLQVTKRMKGLDIYAGGENLTNFRQKDVIISSPYLNDFDASCVWGPIMGVKFYAGLRFTLWKTE